MVAESNGLDLVQFFFMKGSHGFIMISIYLNGSSIYFTHGLNLNIITPYSILTFTCHIVIKSMLASNYELNKKVSFTFNVVNASLPDQIVLILIALVNLM